MSNTIKFDYGFTITPKYRRILEVGENTILISDSISMVRRLYIQYGHEKSIKSSELIPTEQGTLMYFEEDIPDEIKKETFLVIINFFSDRWCSTRTLEWDNKLRAEIKEVLGYV